ncbi:ABC transporter ATP-binding protein [Citreicella sp. C3M06]|uniref:ABC transporter ATP-binding protein n=1 Tax=Citreicella sp. C3M06 TaxID=2841564 RepID=UPI001C097306|nr:ABC transporter ATP-binding protein [Citreicella sp. C3M06]
MMNLFYWRSGRLCLHPALEPVLAKALPWFPLVFVLGLLGTALEGMGIGLLIPLLDLVAGHDKPLPAVLAPFGRLLPENDRGVAIGLVILCLILLKNLVAYVNTNLLAWIYGRSGHVLRQKIGNDLLRADSRFLMTAPPHRLLNVISNESWRAADAVGTLFSIAVSAAACIALLTFLLLLSPPLTAALAVGLAGVQLLVHLATRRVAALGAVVTAENRRLAARMLHIVEAWRLIRLYGRQAHEMEDFARASDSVRRAVFAVSRAQALLGPLTEIAYALQFFAIALIAWSLGTPFSVVIAFTVLLYRLQPQVRQIQNALVLLRGWTGSLDEVSWLVQTTQHTGQDAPTVRVEGPRLRQSLRFEQVSFRYPGPGEKGAGLDTIDLEIPAGKSVALIGRSGSGKSTIAALMCGLIAPDSGRIVLDGRDMRELDAFDWRERVAVVGAELELVEGTIADNIRYGHPGATDVQIEAAAQAADAAGFIADLPAGYRSEVGYRGHNLSAGQRQRIALARALVRQPDLLILDEATNSMDVLSESAILAMLAQQQPGRTVVVISHTASVIRECSDYFLLDGGRVVANGHAADIDVDRLSAVFAGQPADPPNRVSTI